MRLRQDLMMAAMLIGIAMVIPHAAYAADEACKLQISGNDLMQYDKKELDVSDACTQVQVTLKHVGKLPKEAMGHNWVLVKAADLNGVANAGMAAGLQNNYVAPGDKRVLAATQVVAGGESATVTFSTSMLKKGESYMYLCTFPGHNSSMRGTFKFG
ncbi:MAG TPA: azurin [Steroidobacteraceae bacterium]|jgi:azurin